MQQQTKRTQGRSLCTHAASVYQSEETCLPEYLRPRVSRVFSEGFKPVAGSVKRIVEC
jgi:hypothetical protein